MADNETQDKHLALIESELRFIRRHVQGFTSDFDRADEVGMAVESALREYELGLQPACEEVPAGVPTAA